MDPMPATHADEESSDSEPTERDWAVARVAYLLYQEGMSFEWEQLSDTQQTMYHTLVGQWLQDL